MGPVFRDNWFFYLPRETLKLDFCVKSQCLNVGNQYFKTTKAKLKHPGVNVANMLSICYLKPEHRFYSPRAVEALVLCNEKRT